MFVKEIKCEVKEENREAFHTAQLVWGKLSSAEGFVKQFGGWSGHDAFIVGVWEDKASYDQFMQIIHDEIFEANEQAQTFERISVNLSETEILPYEIINDTFVVVEEGEERQVLLVPEWTVQN
ncbi:DUF4937 domain-containing protein [Bacillus solimangrovi]|uniref:DUF4937 domain-containing protein n=1 Tax=Bacillus solimangrovi TaxID=1305675 RepID=A0A1E5LD29_9BACI|nr:DUF4937 domain-containing protein [Bacillus solimangrovi]OEH91998.1 hypothetical protein BFG57_17180 [Bacillus solimangrovi]